MDLFDLTGKVAVVTGGTRGIGLMMARGLLQAGARVYISSRKAEAGDAAVAELSAFGQVALDPGRPLPRGGVRPAGRRSSASARTSCTSSSTTPARRGARRRWRTSPSSAWDKVVDLNLKSPFFLTRAFLPLLEAAGDGRRPRPGRQRRQHRRAARPADAHLLVLVEQGRAAPPDAGARQGARARGGITVNAVAPGPFESKMMAATLDAFGDEIAARSPLGRIGRPDDMAGVVVYLSSRAGAYVTGAVIPVDGGIATTA